VGDTVAVGVGVAVCVGVAVAVGVGVVGVGLGDVVVGAGVGEHEADDAGLTPVADLAACLCVASGPGPELPCVRIGELTPPLPVPPPGALLLLVVVLEEFTGLKTTPAF